MMSPMSEDSTLDAPVSNAAASGNAEDDSWRDLDSQIARHPTSEDSSALALSRLHGVRIFVAAADPARRSSLAKVLQSLGLGVEAGPPDEAGYRAALAYHPDAVVSELTRPGEAGWWLLQRLRRHPLLRWTPVLLMRWWKDDGKNAASDVLLSRVVENLAEALTPLRVIEERVAAGRPLGDRLELTGALPLLKVLCGAGLTGTLAVNDGWNIFEIDIANGRPARATRRGMGDDETAGEAALGEAALCDFGRWTFKAHGAPPASPNLRGSLDEAIDAIGRRIGLVFGPDAVFHEGAAAGAAVRIDRLRDVASTSTGLAHQLCEVLAGGASREELSILLREGEDRLVIERTIIALMRCGALLPLAPGEKEPLGEEAARSARSAAHVLAWLAAEHRSEAAARAEAKPAGAKTGASTGYYQIAPKREEHIALGPAEGIVAPGAWRPSMTEDLAPSHRGSEAGDERVAFADRPTPALKEDSAAWRRHGGTGETATDDGIRPAPLLYDSLAPSPRERDDRGRNSLWIALGLALLLGALLAAGLVAIGTSAREEPARAAPR
jgi:CheY-like chemotaxis protein